MNFHSVGINPCREITDEAQSHLVESFKEHSIDDLFQTLNDILTPNIKLESEEI